LCAYRARSECHIFCVGNCSSDPTPKPDGIAPGAALMGGHMYPGVTTDRDIDAYRWLLDRAKRGNVVILTADPVDTPCDLYNDFFFHNVSTHVRPRSVSTICFTDRKDSFREDVIQLLSRAVLVFITGGDQSKYFTYWRNSPVSRALLTIPLVGGSSAGLAVQGEIVFDAMHGSVTSKDALRWPLDSEIALTNDMFKTLRWMNSVVTDTHFLQRDRMGRLLTFVARSVTNKWGKAARGVLGVGVSEHTAVLIDGESGKASFVGQGPAYFLTTNKFAPETTQGGLTYRNITVHKWNETLRFDARDVDAASAKDSDTASRSVTPKSAYFSFREWASHGLKVYNISAIRGELHSDLPGGKIY